MQCGQSVQLLNVKPFVHHVTLVGFKRLIGKYIRASIGWHMGSSPYDPDAPRPYRRALCACPII